MMDYTAARVKNLHPRNKLSDCYCLEREFHTPTGLDLPIATPRECPIGENSRDR